jgi:hypothetical protein
MRQAVLQTCESSGIELYAKFRSEREDWVQSMVAAGLGFAFIPEHFVLVEKFRNSNVLQLARTDRK